MTAKKTRHFGLEEILQDMKAINKTFRFGGTPSLQDSKKLNFWVWKNSYRTLEQETRHLGLELILQDTTERT